MSTYRIKGDDGVIIESTKYLELPKGYDSGRPLKPRPGMIRYNAQTDHRGIEASVIVETGGVQSLEWRRVAHLDKDGRLLTSQLPSSITGSLTYKGTWDASINDINETAADVDPPLDPLWPAKDRVGHYYIVRVAGDGAGANDLAPVSSTSNPRYQKGDWIVSNGVAWEKVDQSQITSTASQTQLSVTSMRDAHTIKDSVSLQDAMDRFVEHALDRYGDKIRGTISVSTDAVDPNARILLANGSASKPNLSFVNESNTGLFRDTANTISFTTAGTKRVDLNNTALISTVLIKGANGGAATPSFTFSSNDDTGMFRADANVIGFSTSGVERARILDRGIEALTIAVDKNSATAAGYAFKADLKTGLFSPTAGSVSFTSGGTVVANFKSGEISTTAPIRTSSGTAAAPAQSFTADTKTGMFLSKAGFLNFSAFGKDVLELNNETISVKETARFVDGTLAIPSISFINDVDTGFMRSADNTIEVVTAGTSVMTYGASSVTMNGATLITDGTVSAPGLAFASDVDTGIFKPSPKSLSIATNGKTVLTADSAQKVVFAVKASYPNATAATPSIIFEGQENCGLFGAANKVGIATGGAQRLAADNSGVTVSTRLNAPSGTSAAPGLILGTAGTGLYAPAAKEFGIAADGTPNLTFTKDTNTSVVQLQLSLGSTAAPSVAFTGDANTGMYRKGLVTEEKNITFAVNGADVFQVTPTYTNPLTPVKLINGAKDAPGICFDANVKTGLYSANGNVITTIAGADKLTVASGGVTVSTSLVLGSNLVNMSKGSIQTSTTGTMQFKADDAAAPFTFGKGTDVYMTVAPGGIIVPIGTSAQRPTSPNNGMIRYNSDIKNLEGYLNGNWAELAGSGKITDKGTAGTPSITFGTDTSTGIYSDGTDVIAFAAGGVKQAQIDTNNATFYKPVIIDTGTGSIKIGSTNTGYVHFASSKPVHFDKQVQAVDFKVYNKDTALQSDGKIKENGVLLESKYVPFNTEAAMATILGGTQNIKVKDDSSLFWYNSSDYARIKFQHTGLDSDTDNHMLFETGDNGNEYFKFAHKLSGQTTNATWMDVKKEGITVTGSTSTMGDWTFTDGVAKYKNATVMTIDPSGSVTLNGNVTGSSGALPSTGGTMSGSLELASAYPQIIFTETDQANKKYVMVGDGKGIRLNEDTTVGKAIWSYTPTNDALELYKPSAPTMGTAAKSLTTKEYVDSQVTEVDGKNLTLAKTALAVDLDTLGARSNAGIYFQEADVNATSANHYPIARSGTLIVTPSAYGCHQEYTTYDTSRKFVRGLSGTWNGSNGPWTAWKEYYGTMRTPSPAELGADATGTANTLVQRDSAADVQARLFRSSYQNDGYMNGAIAFRTNNTSDNYTRYCSNPGAVMTWLGALPLTGGTLSGGLTVTGDLWATGNVGAYHSSDRRLKKDITNIDSALDSVLKLQGVKYVMKADKLEKVQCGFIAQDVREVIPEVVGEHAETGMLGVDYAKMTAYLVEAIKEQQALIKELQEEVRRLGGK